MIVKEINKILIKNNKIFIKINKTLMIINRNRIDFKLLILEGIDFEMLLAEVKNFEKLLAEVEQQINIEKHRENSCLKMLLKFNVAGFTNLYAQIHLYCIE